MDFKGRYLMTLRDQDPSLFRELRRNGTMDQHLQEKSTEAHTLLRQMLAHEPKDEAGMTVDPQAERLAEERVWAQMLDFPRESVGREPPDDLRS